MEDEKKEEEQEVVPVGEHGPEDFLIKHPLQNSWTFWYFEADKTKHWEDNQREIFSFDTIEDFWSLYNHIKTASELKPGCDYSLFKKGVRPMWEDEANKKGGRWLFCIEKKQRSPDVDKYWLEVILCMIGEAFDAYSDDVCGAVISIRPRKDKIGLWISDSDQSESVLEIGRKLRERLKIPPNIQLGYQAHADSEKSGSMTRFSMLV
ncbi:UNVERIFIED_CONTAM: hypothetical protein PYX00_008986 [Menopon gallinae]|uniref:eIF-4F 25 kDa subunit n=1 Tax=Menopon gallinae TaxID=328185 RepID=A0AAW2HA75_9NEOP